jgi:hypothetical protein
MLTREQVRILTGWSEGRLKRLMSEGKIFENPEYGFHPFGVYAASRKGREALRQLMHLCPVGKWWVKFYRWRDLEAAGLVTVEGGRVRLSELGSSVVELLREVFAYKDCMKRFEKSKIRIRRR